jgi:hypothetical protein
MFLFLAKLGNFFTTELYTHPIFILIALSILTKCSGSMKYHELTGHWCQTQTIHTHFPSASHVAATEHPWPKCY